MHTVTVNPKAVAAYTIDLMEQTGLSQSELARRLNITPTSVNKWAMGYAAPADDLWPAIEREFQLTPGTLTVVALGGPQSPEFLAVLRSTLPLIDSSDEPGAERLRVAVLAAVEELQRSLDAVGDGAG